MRCRPNWRRSRRSSPAAGRRRRMRRLARRWRWPRSAPLAPPPRRAPMPRRLDRAGRRGRLHRRRAGRRGRCARLVARVGEARPGVPHSLDATWRLASVTKQLTALIVMQEVAAGRLDLDAPMATLWPEWPAPERARRSRRACCCATIAASPIPAESKPRQGRHSRILPPHRRRRRSARGGRAASAPRARAPRPAAATITTIATSSSSARCSSG